MLKYIKRLNPERNLITRAAFYVIGCGGLIHLTTLFILAITRHKASYFNPSYTVDIDQVWPAVSQNAFLYVLGWVVFISAIYVVYRSISKKNH